VKSWVRIRIEIKNLELERLKMEPRRTMDAHNRDVDAQNE